MPVVNKLAWYERTFFVNLLYDYLGFDQPPTFDAMEKTFNLLSLVDALLLTIVFAVPMSVNYQELEAANARYRDEQSGYHKWWKMLKTPFIDDTFGQLEGTYSSRLNYYLVLAMAFLSMSFLSVLMCYIAAANSVSDSYEDVDLSHGHKASHRMMQSWWKYTRWLVFAQTIFTALGFVLVYLSIFVLIEIKFPDPYRESLGTKKTGGSNLLSTWPSPGSPHEFNYYTFEVTTVLTTVVTATFLSCAIRNRYWVLNNPTSRDTLFGMGIRLPAERWFWRKVGLRDSLTNNAQTNSPTNQASHELPIEEL